MSLSFQSFEYIKEDLTIDELHKLLYMEPGTIYTYYIYEIKFYFKLDSSDTNDEREEREQFREYMLVNYQSGQKICKTINLGFILKAIIEDDILVTIKNTLTNQYVGILSCKDLYPKNAFELTLLCSIQIDPHTQLSMAFGLLLQHILISYIYDEYEYETDEAFSIYLKALETVHSYYLKLGYLYGNDCSNNNEYKFRNDDDGLYSMKLCNLNRSRTIIYNKILSYFETSWKNALVV